MEFVDSLSSGSSDSASGSEYPKRIDESIVLELISDTVSQFPTLLPERFRRIDNDQYKYRAERELAGLQFLLEATGLEIRIEQLAEGSYFCFKLCRIGVEEPLGYTSCVIRGNDAVPMLPHRECTEEWQRAERDGTQYPVIQMEFTEMTANGFNGAEIIQRYIMCLCAIEGVCIMIKDIMTDFAGRRRDWNWNIDCIPREIAFNPMKYGSVESTFVTWATLSQESSRRPTLRDILSKSSHSTSSSERTCTGSQDSAGSAQCSQGDYDASDDGDNLTCFQKSPVPDFNTSKITELTKYIAFQYNVNIQKLLISINELNTESEKAGTDEDKFKRELADLHRKLELEIAKMIKRLSSAVPSYIREFYSVYYIDGVDARNAEVSTKEETAMRLFKNQHDAMSDLIQTMTKYGANITDYECSAEAMLLIADLFEGDFLEFIEHGHTNFERNLWKIAEKVIMKFQPEMQGENLNTKMKTFARGLHVILQAPVAASRIYSPRTQRAENRATNRVGRQKSKDPAGLGGNPTKKAQHKNKRSSKRKKNKKRAIKTQKKKHKKTRK